MSFCQPSRPSPSASPATHTGDASLSAPGTWRGFSACLLGLLTVWMCLSVIDGQQSRSRLPLPARKGEKALISNSFRVIELSPPSPDFDAKALGDHQQRAPRLPPSLPFMFPAICPWHFPILLTKRSIHGCRKGPKTSSTDRTMKTHVVDIKGNTGPHAVVHHINMCCSYGTSEEDGIHLGCGPRGVAIPLRAANSILSILYPMGPTRPAPR